MDEKIPETKETDLLKYKGNEVPRLIRLWWSAVIIFSVIYLFKFMVPDLGAWLKALK